MTLYNSISVYELLKRQVQANPNSDAVINGTHWMTFQQLDQQAHRIATFLLKSGLKQGSVVAIELNQSLEMVVAFWGVLLAGGISLPIVKGTPEQYIKKILKHSQTSFHIKNKELKREKTQFIKEISFEQCIEDITQIEATSESLPIKELDSHTPVFMIYPTFSYTSTEAVCVSMDNLMDWLQFTQDKLRVDFNSLLFLGKSGMETVFPIWMGNLLNGGCVHFLNHSISDASRSIKNYMEEQSIKTISSPISYIESMISECRDYKSLFPDNLKYIISYGEEAFSLGTFRQYVKDHQIKWYNYYGFPEIHLITAILDEPGQGEEPKHIGRLLPQTNAFILNKENQLVSLGVKGELYVSGKGMIQETHQSDRSNFQRFFNVTDVPGKTVYKTGYQATWMEDWKILLSGRTDGVMNIKGCRFLPEEIEETISTHPLVRECAISVKQTENEKPYFRIYLEICETTVQGKDWQSSLENFLKKNFPEEIFPIGFAKLSFLPRSLNGWVDRNYLDDSGFVDSIQLQSFEKEIQTQEKIKDAALVISESNNKQGYLRIRKGIEFQGKKTDLVVAATFTSDLMADTIKYWMSRFNLEVEIRFALYNQVFQQILDEDSLISTNNGINLLFFRFEDWVRYLEGSEEEKCQKLEKEFEFLLHILENKKRMIPYLIGIFPISTHLLLSPQLFNKITQLNKRWAEALPGIENVQILDFTQLGEQFNIKQDFNVVMDRNGHMPFSREYYAAMGTIVSRKLVDFSKKEEPQILPILKSNLHKACQDISKGATLKEFLTDLTLQVSMDKLQPSQAGIVSRLTQRTNQFNLCNMIRSETEVLHLYGKPGSTMWVVDVKDSFGDYGIVGAVMTKKRNSDLLVESFLLSCTVLGRGVEDVILSGLKNYCQELGLTRMVAHYYPTHENRIFLNFLKRTHWMRVQKMEGHESFQISTDMVLESPDYIDFYFQKRFRKEISTETAGHKIQYKKERKIMPVKAHQREMEENLSLWNTDASTILKKLSEIPEEIDENREIPQGAQGIQLYYQALGSRSFSRQIFKDNLYEMFSKKGIKKVYLELFQVDVLPRIDNIIDYKELHSKGKIIQKDVIEIDLPKTRTEKVLARIWKEILGLGNIGVNDSFFKLGGHSLKATVLVSRIQKELNVNIPLGQVFTFPTIKELAEKIGDTDVTDLPDIRPEEEKEYYKLSFAQRRLWVLCQFEEDSTAYNMPGAFVVSGKLQTQPLEKALLQLVDRHESLRTVFIMVGGEPRQRVLRSVTFQLKQFDLRDLSREKMEAETRHIYTGFANKAFDLAKGPLINIQLVQQEEEQFVFLFNIHHIISDGWSQGVLMNELRVLYNTCCQGKENTLPSLKLHYKDYTLWHNGLISKGHYYESQQYWLERFKDKPNGNELPLDHPRKAIQTFNGGRIAFVVDERKATRLRQLSLRQDVTIFMSLLASINVLLYKYSGQREIFIGAPIAGRKQPELHDMIGFLVNTLVYRNQVEPKAPFTRFLEKVRKSALESYEYQDYPFDLLVDKLNLGRDLSQSPLFNVMVAHNNTETMDTEAEISDIIVSPYRHMGDFNMSKFDLIFFLDDNQGKIFGSIEYNNDLFEKTTIERMASNYLTLLENLLEKPESPVFTLSCLKDSEQERLLNEFNNTSCDFPGQMVQQQFEREAFISQDKTAVVFIDKAVTYGELNLRANQLAHYLRHTGQTGPGDIIGISLERSMEMIRIILGIIKSGAGYLAMDPGFPRERILHMIKDSSVTQLIVDAKRVWLTEYRGEILHSSQFQESLSQMPVINPEIKNKPGDILYVIYTSGSTGTPNGAVLTHGILANLIYWQKENTSINNSLNCLQFTTTTFCVSFQEIIGTLTASGTLYLIGEARRQNIDYLIRYLYTYRIEILYLPFSYLNYLFNETSSLSHAGKTTLKHIITAGEQLKITSGLKQFFEQNPDVKLHNHYGSSEMHVVTSFTLDNQAVMGSTLPPAGEPISNTRIWIMDEFYNPQPIGVWGEVCVEGSEEVAGYINNPGLTHKKRIQHRLTGSEKYLYCSGDVGRWLDNGNIELKGRKDTQVKIRGFRVDPGEIESKLVSIDRIKDVVVMVKEDPREQKHLIAYVKAIGIDSEEIKHSLSRDLPKYMIPRVIFLEQLPLMPNGKVDRDRLPEPDFSGFSQYIPPRNDIDEKLLVLWERMLGKDGIGIHDDFFEVGGHSLIIQKLINSIHKTFQVILSFRDIFQNPSIAELSDRISQSETSDHVEIQPLPQRDFYELSFSQKRLWLLYINDKSTSAFNLCGAVALNEEVREEIVRQVFDQLIKRQESFRTVFRMIQGNVVQIILKDPPLNLEYTDLSGFDEEETAKRRREIILTEGNSSFELEKDPPLRVKLIKCRKEEWYLVVNMHHIISDGWSMEILEKEFIQIYDSLKNGKNLNLQPLRVHYKDYAAWQNQELSQKEKLAEAREFWRSQLREETMSLLNLPYDQEQSVQNSKSTHSSGFRILLEQELLEGLTQITRKEGASLFTLLLTGFNVLLSHISGQRNILVGMPGAARQHEDLKNIIGFFVNTLILQNQVQDSDTFIEFLAKVRENMLKVLEYQSYPLELICGELKMKYPDISVFFNMSIFGNTNQLILRNQESFHLEEVQAAKFDMVWYVTEYKNGIEITCHYLRNRFKPYTIERILKLYETIMKGIALDPNNKVFQYCSTGKKRKLKRNIKRPIKKQK